jgi:glycolate oxidase FAD binding subunit
VSGPAAIPVCIRCNRPASRMSSEASTVAPASVDELTAALRDTAAKNAVVGIAGAGSKAGWGALPRAVDVKVAMTQLTGVIEYAPGDLVVTVRAGTQLSQLQEELAPHDQWLALDPPEDGATIGGILATATSGPHRLRYGTPRDQLIGITVALADGTLAKSGGKVVKNVAGYDLGKLFTGSYGTLGVIVSATFKLQPLATARRVVTAPAGEPGHAWAAIARTGTVPSAVEWDGRHVRVLLEGASSAVDDNANAVAFALGTIQISEQMPDGFGSRPWATGQVAIKMTHRLSAIDDAISAARAVLSDVQMSAHVGSGVIWCGWSPPRPSEVAAAVDELRAAMASYDGTAVVVDAPADVKQRVDVWGPVRGLALMHRIKDQFDPDHRMNPGRFVDGI